MEAIWQWGINLIVAIQQFHTPLLGSIFLAITFLGDEQFYLILLPLLLWCVNYSFAAGLSVFFLFSNYLNIILKDLFQQPRPFDINPALKLSHYSGYGMPSGHAQMTVMVWGAMAYKVRKTWFWLLAVAIVLLVGFSRVYLGVHFPTDVFAGWIIGVILLVVYIVFGEMVGSWLAGLKLGWQLLLAAGVPLLLLLTHPVTDVITTAGTLLGMATGLVLARRYISFSVGGPWWQRAVRFLIGVIILFALYLGLKAVFPGDASSMGAVFRFLRYAIIGMWVTLGAPWLFRMTRLASAE